MAKVIEFQDQYEESWLRCRALSFLHTAYYDDIRREKERYAHPSVSLVAINSDEVIGLIDIEMEEEPGQVCGGESAIAEPHRAGMIWHLAVHPDYRRRSIAGDLLKEAAQRCSGAGLRRLESWTRDDEAALGWYRAMGFSEQEQYVHWYYNRYRDGEDLGRELFGSAADRIVEIFCHAAAPNEAIRRLTRWHICRRFDLLI
jgi:ribosomal protein S18 acetylase RimI-like enzyme